MRYWTEANFDALDILRPVTKKHGLTEAECAIRWMNHHSMLKREKGDAIIIGASSTKHMEQNMVSLSSFDPKTALTHHNRWTSRRVRFQTRSSRLWTLGGRRQEVVQQGTTIELTFLGDDILDR